MDKRIINILVIIFLTFLTFSWTFWIFHKPFMLEVVIKVSLVRILASLLIMRDFSMAWSKVTQKTFFIKILVNSIAFIFYMPFFYTKLRISFMLSELAFYLLIFNFVMYGYYLFINRIRLKQDKTFVIYGAGGAGVKLSSEFKNSKYALKYFVDDDESLQNRSIDGIKIISKEKLKKIVKERNKRFDLLIIAMPSIKQNIIKKLYEELKEDFDEIKILPPLKDILNRDYLSTELKKISLEDLLARNPQDLDKGLIGDFIKNKVVFITGAGGSIGSELSRQCLKYGAKKLVLLDHSEYNLYTITEELNSEKIVPILQNVVQRRFLKDSICKHKPDIVIHAAAYKHVPMVEYNINEAIINNIIGTKNCIDSSIECGVKKFILISTDKAIRPTNVMGATKRVCELYAQNVDSYDTEIVAVRFGNVLGSSGSVIPKFQKQIQKGGPITVTHPEITRYFMLIPEACELVLQAGAIAKGGEIFILDMGEPVKIVDLAKKMIELSGRSDIDIVYTGLRAGEKLYEELLIDEAEQKSRYESILVAKKSIYDINRLNDDIEELLKADDKISKLKEIVPEFNHKASEKERV